MFWKKNKKKVELTVKEEAERMVSRAENHLKMCGLKNVEEYHENLIDFYISHNYMDIREVTCKGTSVLMVWFILRYGTEDDFLFLDGFQGSEINKPERSIYFYWIPSQTVRMCQLARELKKRSEDPNSSTGPDPTMPMHELETMYVNLASTVNMLYKMQGPPVNMQKSIHKLQEKTEKFLSNPEEFREETLQNTIGLQNKQDYLEVKDYDIKPKSPDDVYGYTDYLQGDVAYCDVGKKKSEVKRNKEVNLNAENYSSGVRRSRLLNAKK